MKINFNSSFFFLSFKVNLKKLISYVFLAKFVDVQQVLVWAWRWTWTLIGRLYGT